MKLKQQVTNLELSKKLKELGVKQESQFYWYGNANMNTLQRVEPMEIISKADGKMFHGGVLYSAYTVAESGEMLPDYFKSGRYNGKYYADQYEDNFDLLKGYSTEADARGEMVAYLFENNLSEVKIKEEE